MIKHTKFFALISFFGHAVFFVLLLFEHFFRTELSPLSHFLSEYSLGPYGWIHITAFVILAISQLFLFAGLLLNLNTSVLSIVTFSLYTLGIILVVVFPTDSPGSTPTLSGKIHGYAALIGFASFSVAMFAWGFNFYKEYKWKKIARTTFWLSAVAIVIFSISFFTPSSLGGLFQRLLLLCNITWLLIISLHLSKSSTTQ